MSLVQMSISAGLLIVAIALIRAVALDRLPKTTFLVLWAVVLIRLLVPIQNPTQFAFYPGGSFASSDVTVPSLSENGQNMSEVPTLVMPLLGGAQSAEVISLPWLPIAWLI